MVIISEFLPNPVGADAHAEWIELFNNKNEIVDLSGWKIKDASGKTFLFNNASLQPFGYLVLNSQTTKISLNNNGEAVYLYDNQNNLIDKAEYAGSAPAGQSIIRQNGKFVFTETPTPGKANIFENKKAETNTQKANTNLAAASHQNFPLGASPINNPRPYVLNFSVGAISSLIFAVIFVIIWKKFNQALE